MKKKIKIAIVGTGYFSKFHFDAWKRLGVDVTGICSLNIDEAEKQSYRFKNCKTYKKFSKMINDIEPDLVDIIVPPSKHLELIRIAAEKKINIICQKPFTNSLTQAKKAVEIAKKNKIIIAVHENFRFQPWFKKIFKILKSNLLGELFQVSFRMRPGDGQGPNAYLDRQPYFQNMKKFLIHETAIHFIDLYRYFFGEIESVYASLSQLNEVIAGEDCVTVIFKFKNGIKGIFDANRLSDHIAEDRRLTIGEMIVEGSDGTIRLNGDGKIFYRKFGSNNEKLVKYKWINRGFAGDSVYFYQKHVLNHFQKGQELSNSAENYLMNILVENCIYKSDKLKKMIYI